jgi:hypothetical protein
MQDFNTDNDSIETTLVHVVPDDFSALTPVLGAVNDSMRWGRITSAFSQGLSSIEKVLIHSETEETKRQHSKDKRDERIEEIQSHTREEIERINKNFELRQSTVSDISKLADRALCSGNNEALESLLNAMVRVVKE